MRLLLVEDDSMIGDSVRHGLRQDGFTVDWVRDGRAAELALANEVYDVLLLDLGLPKKGRSGRAQDVAPQGRQSSGDDPDRARRGGGSGEGPGCGRG